MTHRFVLRTALVVLLVLWGIGIAFAKPPLWARAHTKIVKTADYEDVIVEVDGEQRGLRIAKNGKKYDLVWERDPKFLGLKKHLHPHEIVKVFPDELAPLPGGGILPPLPPSWASGDQAPVTIDVNVFYSQNALAGIGGTTKVDAFIALSCALTTQTYANSGMPWGTWRCHNVGLATGYDEASGTNALTWLGSDPGAKTLVANAYAATGADLTHMYTTGAGIGGACGYGYLTVSASNALSVSDQGCANSNLSFPHETGHNVGWNHDPPSAQCNIITSPGSGLPCCGAAPSTGQCTSANYGHSFPIGAPQWRTVEAYPGAGGSRITIESSPTVFYQGNPTGIANERDNVRVAIARAPVVAAFRTAVAPTGHPPSKFTNFQIVQ